MDRSAASRTAARSAARTMLSALATVVSVAVVLLGCSGEVSTGTADTTIAGSVATTAPLPTPLQTGYSAVAVATDHAVVADGSVPTRFSIATLSADGAGDLRPVEPGPPLSVRAVLPVDDRVLIAGNSCDSLRDDASPDDACVPGRAVIGLFDPGTGEWVDLSIGGDDDDVVLGNVAAVTTPDHHATVYATGHDAGSGQAAKKWLFDLDLRGEILSAVPLPTELLDGADDGEVLVCLPADGSALAIAGSSGDSASVSSPGGAWMLEPASGSWHAAALPDVGSHPPSPDGCVAGRPIVTTSDGARFVFGTGGSWEPYPKSNDLFGGAARGVPVVGSVGEQRWVGGQIWDYDPDAVTFIAMGVPHDPIEGTVHASAAWNEDRVVALIDSSPGLVDERDPGQTVLEVFPTD